MSALQSVIWYLRDAEVAFTENYTQGQKVAAVDRVLKAIDGDGSYFPMWAPETENYIRQTDRLA